MTDKTGRLPDGTPANRNRPAPNHAFLQRIDNFAPDTPATGRCTRQNSPNARDDKILHAHSYKATGRRGIPNEFASLTGETVQLSPWKAAAGLRIPGTPIRLIFSIEERGHVGVVSGGELCCPAKIATL